MIDHFKRDLFGHRVNITRSTTTEASGQVYGDALEDETMAVLSAEFELT